MELHLPTLLIVLVMLAATLTFVVGTLAAQSRRDGLRQFTVGLALQVLTYGAVGLRGRVDDALLLSLGNVALSSAFAMFNEALFRFQRRQPSRWLLWSPPVTALLLQPWLYGRMSERVIVMAVLVALQCTTALALLMQRRRETVGLGQYMLGVNFLIIVATLTYRAVAIAMERPLKQMDASLLHVQGVSFLLGAMAMVVMALSFVIMTKEAADERNRVLAMRDELTGLGNRRTLMDSLTQQAALSQRSGLPLSVLVIDIDHFKSVNDTYGHFSGDEALREVAELMRASLRRQDIVGRLGGEEFLAILPGTPKAGAMLIGEKLRANVEASVIASADGTRMPITISVGLHAFDPRTETSTDDVVRAADEALYKAKSEGRNRVVAA